MRHILSLLLIGAASLLASCASNNNANSDSPSAIIANGTILLRNDSTSTLTLQRFEASTSGETRQPFGDPIIIPPGQTESRVLARRGRIVALTIKASGQDIKYQSGEWVLKPRFAGFRLYAFTDDSGTVRLNWDDRGGEEIQMQ